VTSAVTIDCLDDSRLPTQVPPAVYTCLNVRVCETGLVPSESALDSHGASNGHNLFILSKTRRASPGLAAPQVSRAGRSRELAGWSCLQFLALGRVPDRPGSGLAQIHLISRFQRRQGSPHSQISALTRFSCHTATPGCQDFESCRSACRSSSTGAQARGACRKWVFVYTSMCMCTQ